MRDGPLDPASTCGEGVCLWVRVTLSGAGGKPSDGGLNRDEGRTEPPERLHQVCGDLEERRRLVHIEDIGRFAPALKERHQRPTQRRMDDSQA
jgi:hypothetical protein